MLKQQLDMRLSLVDRKDLRGSFFDKVFLYQRGAGNGLLTGGERLSDKRMGGV